MNDSGMGKKKSGKVAADRPVARMLVRAIWAQERNVLHSAESPEERFAAWTEVREELMRKNLAHYGRALTALRNAGVVIIPPGQVGGGQGKAENEDEDGED